MSHLRQFVLLSCLAVGLCGIGVTSSEAGDEKPNVVFILADDFGYADLACYGHPYARTPAIDQFAREGTAFRNFHVTGVTCCPSRAGFMTSKFPATFRKYPADYGYGDRMTVTQILRDQGYRTGHFGKWHMGPDAKPGTYGIDVVGDESGAEGRRHQDPRGRDAQIFDQAIQFITENKDRPFYVNVWGHITHFPVDPPPAWSDRFKDLTVKDADFKEPMREKFEMVRQAGGDVSQRMRNYLGDVMSMDESVGRLLKAIDGLGLREKTIVVFSSDQGAAPVRLPAQDNGKKTGKKGKRTTSEQADLRLNMLGYAGELRGGKHNMYEGGVRVPFIIRWPGHVPAGRVDDKSLICGIDWLPTLCRLADAKLPSNDFDGEDVSDIWLGKSRSRTKPLFWKTSNVRSEVAMLDGQWKLFVPSGRRGEIELYDLSSDPSESRNLAPQRPDLVRTLENQAQQWNSTLPSEYLKSGTSDDAK